jgi:hypothetical protein
MMRRLRTIQSPSWARRWDSAGGAGARRRARRKGEITLGIRAYTAARIGTQSTDYSFVTQGDRQTFRSMTFPVSPAGHLRQSRFAEVEMRRDIDRLIRDGFGPLGLLNDLRSAAKCAIA